MKKFLTVLLVIAVMFTFSFGSAMAVTYSASDVASAYAAEMNTQLGYLATAKARAIALYTYDTDGYTTGAYGEPEGLTKESLGVAADYIIDLAEKAMTEVVNAAAEQTYSDDTASIDTDAVRYALVIDKNGNGEYDGTDNDNYDTTDYDVDDLNNAWNLWGAIQNVPKALDAAYEAQEPVSRAFFTGKINGVDLSKYSDTDKEYAESIGTGSFLEETAAVQTGTVLTPAGYVDYLESVAVAEIAAKAATTDTDANKVLAYKTIADKFAALVKTIATTADEEYNDTIEKTVEQAVDAYLAYGKGELYDACKLVDENNDGKYIERVEALKALTGAIYEPKTPYSKATLFGVEVADITKITKAEATAINNAFYKAIVDSAEVVRAYAGTDASKVAELYTAMGNVTPAVYATVGSAGNGDVFRFLLRGAGELFVLNGEDYVKVANWTAYVNAGKGTLYKKVAEEVPAHLEGNATKFLATLDKAVEAVGVYGDVVDLGEAYKAETIVGVKTYDDANVDKAVAEAKTLIYEDLVARFDTPAEYIRAAADKLDINIYAVNYEYNKFQKAMDDAYAKMWESEGKPARKVTYGENKTADEDLVYLKGTYAASEASDWTDIANDATEAIYNAESYADIEAALKAAAEDFGKLLTAKDEVAVVTARAKYVNALNDFVGGQKKIMGTVNYSLKAFTDAQADGEDLINDANTVADVEAAYKEAQGLVTGIKTKTELKAMKDALVAQIAALPKASALTVADKAAVVAAFDAYKEYDGTSGATDVIVNANLLKDALETVYTLEGKDLQAKVDAVEKELKKLAPNGYAVSDDAAAELASKRAEYKALYDAVDAFNEEITNDDETGVNNYFADLVDQININKIETALYSEEAVWNGELMNVGVLAVKATKAGATVAQQKEALNAYNALTDRQKYAMDSNVLELIKRVEANITDAVQALKITASSKATKGAITVTWKVVGDKEAADGYVVARSTKKNAGFKKMFTTKKLTYKNTKGLKKGTRYYYKVRAYKVVDGVTYYSDWSNKAYRVAK